MKLYVCGIKVSKKCSFVNCLCRAIRTFAKRRRNAITIEILDEKETGKFRLLILKFLPILKVDSAVSVDGKQ